MRILEFCLFIHKYICSEDKVPSTVKMTKRLISTNHRKENYKPHLLARGISKSAGVFPPQPCGQSVTNAEGK